MQGARWVLIHCKRSIHQGTKMLRSLHPCASGGRRVDILLNQAWLLHADGSSFLAGHIHAAQSASLLRRAWQGTCANSQVGFHQSLDPSEPFFLLLPLRALGQLRISH